MINSKGSWDPFGEIEGRCCHSALSFEDKIWLIGGVYELNDVWYSNDGKYWTCATANAEFGARHYHTSIVYNDKMWVFAGYPNKSDVWYSDSGEKWTSVTSSAPFGSRSGHTTVVFNNAIYLIGGNNNVAWYDQNVKFYNDVWYSRNGIDWELICPSAPFPGRTYHASTVFDGKIWVIGGIDGINDLNDCWSSKDGINWVKETDSAAFTPRRYHSVLSYDSALWLFSGFTMSRHETSSIWHSIDGEAWRRIDGYQTVPYSHASFVHRDTMWILGGYNSSNTTYFSVGLK
jgi:N-acetylneuraminic acid mutarotase